MVLDKESGQKPLKGESEDCSWEWRRLELAKWGHTVIGCSRAQDKLNSLQSELSASLDSNSTSSDKHLFLNADVRSNSSVEELARIVMEKKGAPDIIVNNAGIINKNNKISEVPVEEFDAVLNTNVKCTANVLHHFIPLMIAKNQGIIVNMSSGWQVVVSDYSRSHFLAC